MPHITFIHGIGNKPEPEKLLQQWKVALSDNDGPSLDELGVTTSMVYWADMLYSSPAVDGAVQEAAQFELDAIPDPEDADMSWLEATSPAERQFVEGLAQNVGLESVSLTTDEVEVEPIVPTDPVYEIVPLPAWLTKRLMRVLLRDVHHYLYDVTFSPRAGESYQIRTDIRERVLNALNDDAQQTGPHLLVGHSLGSVIAYDALTAIEDAPRVDALMTVGSPLGISEVRDGLTPPWTERDGWPSERLADGNWWNVFDLLDPVCGALDRKLAPHYRRGGKTLVADISVTNSGRWRHSISKYLGQPSMRAIINSIFA